MKKNILFILLFIVGVIYSPLKAQQLPQSSHYMFNQFAYNPALAGIKSCIDIHTGARFQWVGLEGAPKTGFLNVSVPIKTKKNNVLAPTHGVGLQAELDQIGPFGELEVQAAYAIHIRITRELKFSAGAFLGFKQLSMDANRASTIYPDPAVTNSAKKFIFPDGSLGLWLHNKKFYAGLSYNQLFRNKWDKIGLTSRYTNHITLTGGYKIPLKKHFSFIPSVMMKFAFNTTPSIDLTAMVDYKNIISLGLTYRNEDALAVILKANILNYVFVAYSYDISTSKLKVINKGSHEISLGIYTCRSKGKDTNECPVFE